jgi:cytidine deaminase
MYRTGDFTSNYRIYPGLEALPGPERELMLAAHEATSLAYAPYSNFHVGAALRLHNGVVIRGGNQENASYPLCLCAERVALAAASCQGRDVQVDALAVTARNRLQPMIAPIPPCGACRQVIEEKRKAQDAPIQIILQGEVGEVYVFSDIRLLLPFYFDGDFLRG